MEDKLDQAARNLKLNQVPDILRQLKGGVEVFFGVGFHTTDHPMAGLAGEFRQFYGKVLAAEKAHEEWLAKIEDEKCVPPNLVPAWKQIKGMKA